MNNVLHDDATSHAFKRAVLYLRVSSRGQLETDFDDDGLSISAQRARCIEEARKLGAIVVDEYIERAESAKTNGRPELQRMLNRIRTDRDVDYVVVWKVDRFARNRRDDANMLFEIELAGARLVSATENIDETPAGRLMHGMLASFAEYYSRNLANEVVKGATEKAKRGGTPGRVPPGYLNVRDVSNGYEIRTVAPDLERAPLVRWAFEAYATGLYSVSDITALLEARGLRSRATRRCPAKPLGASIVHAMLGNDYYVGIVTYRGTKYPGRHEPLIDRETFDEVQAVLNAHRLSGERDRKHAQYLKGSLYCGACGSRLIYTKNKGRNGQSYDYFLCGARQRRQCIQPYHRVDEVTQRIERHYLDIHLTDDERDRVRNELRRHLSSLEEAGKKEIASCNALLDGLKNEERILLQTRYRSGISEDLFNEELARIQRERQQAEKVLDHLNVRYDDIERMLEIGLDLLSQEAADLYDRADDTTRRVINQAIFAAIWIDDGDVTASQLVPALTAILRAAGRVEAPVPAFAAKTQKAGRAAPSAVLAAVMAPDDDKAPDAGASGALLGLVSSKAEMVARPGLEPGTPRFQASGA